MDKITNPATDTVHILARRYANAPDGAGRRRGRTACGVHILGWTGATSYGGITCGRCLRTLGKDG